VLLDPELIERLRRSGIRIDREGHFVHEGEPVRHEGLRSALFRWLDRLDDGRYVLRLDERRFAYIDVDDTPLVVRALRIDEAAATGAGAAAAVTLQLSDGSDEPLDATTLTIDGEGVLRCWVRAGRIEARLATSAAAVLADRIIETAKGPALALSGQRPPQPLARRPGSRP
jgi:Protein of unknown function (DUF1285)